MSYGLGNTMSEASTTNRRAAEEGPVLALP